MHPRKELRMHFMTETKIKACTNTKQKWSYDKKPDNESSPTSNSKTEEIIPGDGYWKEMLKCLVNYKKQTLTKLMLRQLTYAT